MRPGYPVRLGAVQFPGAEFEGAPLIVGEQVIAAVGTRDNVNLRRSVISIDKRSGAILWRSPPLAAGTVSGSEQASLIANQLLAASGGRVLVNTNLGAIACLDQSSGQIVWLARYRRTAAASDAAYPLPDRYRFRDLTPCMIVGTQVICAPQDAPEIFSLDITSGELLWSTDAEAVDDATQLLGATDQSIVVAGDRIYWLERYSGRVLAAFPAGTTSDAAGALPSPRGYGRGVMGAGRVYWPTQHEIFAFDADQAGRAVNGAPLIRARWRLDTHGAEGGNLVLFQGGVIVAGANRLFVFRQPTKR
jgi:outer membrane protein assembly factor BamB